MIRKQITEIREKSAGYMTAAFSLVAGLAWNDAIKSFIEYAFPFSKSGSVFAKFIYAILITGIVILISHYLLQGTDDKKEIPPKKKL